MLGRKLVAEQLLSLFPEPEFVVRDAKVTQCNRVRSNNKEYVLHIL